MRWLVVALAVVALPRSAHAFCRSTTNTSFVPTEATPCDTTGKPLFWASRCLEVRVHRTASKQVDLDTARAQTATALAAWANVTCDACGTAGRPSLVVREAGPTDCEFGYLRDKPNTNVVIFRDSDWKHDPGQIALTTVSFRKDTGEIVDADVEIDSEIYHHALSTSGAKDAYDLQSLLVHEFGHLMGIAHSPVDDATMRPRYDKGDVSLRDLAQDDVCAMCAVAPPGRDAPCNATSSASCANTPDPSNPGGTTPPAEESSGGCAVGRSSPTAALILLFAIAISRLRSRNGRR